MVFTILLALSGLTLSAVAIYYSVIGLTAIFAAAFWPIVVMGTSLEVSKLVAASWLKANWERIPKLMKVYMMIAVIILMLITSMGIFGFLSKAHSDQSLVSGDVQSKLAIYDEKISTAKENIEAARRQLKQMDEAVDQVMARSTTEAGASRANTIRKSQQRDRTALAKEIETNQKLIASLNDEAAPIRAEIRKVEAEVGPIKYIAKFVYSDNPDANILEKAVTWVIMIIIFVFDPMAVLLLLASQMTWQWYTREKEDDATPVYTYDTFEKPTAEELAEGDSPERIWETEQPTVTESAEGDSLTTESEANIVSDTTVALEEPPLRHNPHPIGWMYPRHANIVDYSVEEDKHDAIDIPVQKVEEPDLAEQVGVEQWNAMLEAAEAELEKEKKLDHADFADQIPVSGVKGQRYRVIKADQEVYFEHDGDRWVEVDSADALERPGDYLTDYEDPKKKSYIVKEHNQQIRKTTE